MNRIDCCGNHCWPLAYICCGASAKVAIVDLEQARHIGDIPCGEGSDPYYIALNPNNRIAYVASYLQKKILMLDLARRQLIGQVDTIGRPRGLDVSPCGDAVYAVFDDQPTMQIFSAQLGACGQIALPAGGDSVTIAAHGRQAYVTQPTLNQTAVIDLCSGSLVARLDTGTSPGRVAYSPENALLLVAGRESHTLTPVDTCRNLTEGNIALGAVPAGLAFARGDRTCLVALSREKAVAAVDVCSDQVMARIPVGELAAGVAASRLYPLAIVSSQIASTVAIIDTQALKVSSTLRVGEDPAGVAVTC